MLGFVLVGGRRDLKERLHVVGSTAGLGGPGDVTITQRSRLGVG